MQLQPSPITDNQWQKVLKAMAYSFGSGFVVGLATAVTGLLTVVTNGGQLNLSASVGMGLLIGGLVGGVNAVAVTIKQVFTPNE